VLFRSLQTLAAVNACWWSFLAGGSTVGCIFASRPRIACDTNRCGVSEMCQGFCGVWLWSVSGCGFVTTAVRPLGARAPRYDTVARLCCRVSKGRRSLWWIGEWHRNPVSEAESRLPSVYPTSKTWTRSGRLAQMVRRKSSGTSRGAEGTGMVSGRPFPHARVVSRCSREVNRRTNSALSPS
jgi:hypothetical protein